ncbi:AbrB/MazE/SpoVT family DNA-binding domain-containing protein [Fodinisporobacter ferrooxydans]|uniref:AbrB/MazE/SpoVT family DNA-binding domain-containing protein n=1 Tax=Fodinisporobacter ferrooxydans TaxID=2901836 RepID=A0ABY4CM04_9BACL|nr:AbrB/MazE/SpoVT family DNA-binding domain-containing protein [Alicyclobacillaceae bacterium MYW30-H2]
MMNKIIFDLDQVQEHRDIKITSKRQLTIPKSFFDHLGVEETVQAYLLEDGIFLKPVRHRTRTVSDLDIESIVRKVISDGYTGEELAKEIAYRINEYNKQMEKRIQQFLDDMKADPESEDGEGEDFNGLDIFFDKEDGSIAQTSK